MKHLFKQIALLLMAITMLFSLAACNLSHSSNISIDELQTQMTKQHSELSFSKKNLNDKIEFSYIGAESVFGEIVVNGTADKNQNILSISIEEDYGNLETLQNADLAYATSKLPWENVAIGKLKALSCQLDIMNLCHLFDNDYESGFNAIVDSTNVFNGKSLTVGDWTIKATLDKSKSLVRIEASFN